MLSKNELKYYGSLQQKKYRITEGKFLVEGGKLVLDALEAGFECEAIIMTNKFFDENYEEVKKFKSYSLRLEIIKQIDFNKLCDTKTPQGIVGVFVFSNLSKELSGNKIIALENISDPGNVGAILRNCDWFGFDQILLSDNCAEVFSPKVIRASAGSVFHIKIKEEKKFYERLQILQKNNYKIICTDLDGQNIYKTKLPDKFVIVFCNEANGPTAELLELSDSKITIPRKGNAESLNVASASAVVLSTIST